MAFWKRKDNSSKPQIPEPVGQQRDPSPQPPSYRSTNSSTYNPSRDGDLASRPYQRSDTSGSDSFRDKYNRNAPVGDPYARGGNADADKAALFAGYDPQRRAGANRFADQQPRGGGGYGDGGYGGGGGDVDEEEDVEAIKTQTKFIKQESLNSTRNALRLAREAEETGRNTLLKLGDQSEKIGSTERHLDVAKGHTNRAADATDELKQLNRSIFRPVITFNKDAKRQAQEEKMLARHEDERNQREKAMGEIAESHQRVGRAATYGVKSGDGPPSMDDEEGIGGGGGRRPGAGGRYRSAEDQKARQAQRQRYQFEATASDDELEDELDDNLDEIGDVAKRLKVLAMATGEELTRQNDRLKTIDEKARNLDNKITNTTDRLGKVR